MSKYNFWAQRSLHWGIIQGILWGLIPVWYLISRGFAGDEGTVAFVMTVGVFGAISLCIGTSIILMLITSVIGLKKSAGLNHQGRTKSIVLLCIASFETLMMILAILVSQQS